MTVRETHAALGLLLESCGEYELYVSSSSDDDPQFWKAHAIEKQRVHFEPGDVTDIRLEDDTEDDYTISRPVVTINAY